MYKTILVALFILFIPLAASSSPEETAKTFIQHLIVGDTYSSVELISTQDRLDKEPLGRFYNYSAYSPIFPSLWKVDVNSTDIQNKIATVHLTVWQPEIEELIRRARTVSIVSKEFLESYLNGNPALSAVSLKINLIQEESGSWKVSTDASKIAWRNKTRHPPEVDVSNPNLQEILEYRDMLADRFPNRASEISELVAPLIATVSTLQNVRFSSSSIKGEPNGYIEGIYEVKFTFENNSEYTVEYLKVVVAGINSNGQVVETDDVQVFYSGSLPQGVPPHGQLVANVGLRATNADEKPIRVEFNILELRIR